MKLPHPDESTVVLLFNATDWHHRPLQPIYVFTTMVKTNVSFSWMGVALSINLEIYTVDAKMPNTCNYLEQYLR